MAEKYGEIPKIFTKDWWEYIWDYYKVHILVIVAIMLLIIFGYNQQRNMEKYDFNVNFIDNSYMLETEFDLLKNTINELIDDTDQNGVKSTLIQEFPISDATEDAQFTQAILSKLQLQFVTQDTMLYIFDKDTSKYIFNSQDYQEAFMPVDEWLKTDVTNDLLYTYNGVSRAVSLKNSSLLKNSSILDKDLYIAVRSFTTDDEKILNTINLSKKVANALMK